MSNRPNRSSGKCRRGARTLATWAGLLVLKTGLLSGIMGAMLGGFLVYTYYQAPSRPVPAVKRSGQNFRLTDRGEPIRQPKTAHGRVERADRESKISEQQSVRRGGRAEQWKVERRQRERRNIRSGEGLAQPDVAYRQLGDLDVEEIKSEQQPVVEAEEGEQSAVSRQELEQLDAESEKLEQLDVEAKALEHLKIEEPELKSPSISKSQVLTKPLIMGHKAQKQQRSPPTLQSLKKEIMSIAPKTFNNVRFEQADDTYIEKEEDWHRGLRSVSVRSVELSVKTAWWDRMNSSEKVKVLYRMFDLLRRQYPQFTRFLKLKFNDGRKDLDLDFGKYDLDRFPILTDILRDLAEDRPHP